MKILSFGEVLFDVYPDKKFIGGAPMNFAAHFARHGGGAAMISALGEDELGDEALVKLCELGLDTSFVARLGDKETGKCLVTLDKNSIPSYNLLNGVAYDFIPCDTIDGEYDALYFGTLALRSEYNLASLKLLLERASFGEVFADLNIRPPFYSRESILFALENATIVKISDEEMPVVLEELGIEQSQDCAEVAKMLAKRFTNLNAVIVTLGAKGALAYTVADGKCYSCDAAKASVVSTVGAGDSFSASFLAKYLAGEKIDGCLAHASKVAAFVVSNYGAVPEYSVKDFE